MDANTVELRQCLRRIVVFDSLEGFGVLYVITPMFVIQIRLLGPHHRNDGSGSERWRLWEASWTSVVQVTG